MVGAAGGWTSASLRAGLWLLLGGWLGAWTLFAFGVAPVAFRSLPAETAGRIVGPVLTALHLYGAGAGVVLALLAAAMRRSRWLVVIPLIMGALCLISQFGVTAAIDRTRELAFGPAGGVEDAARFWRLHGLSMGIYTAVGLLALLLLGLHARADVRPG